MQGKIRIRKGDTVVVSAGKDKGRRGKVLAVHPKQGRVTVEGVNVVKRHMRPSQKMTQGGIVAREAPIHRSNVLLYCPSCNRGTRVGKNRLEDGNWVRVCRRCGEVLDK